MTNTTLILNLLVVLALVLPTTGVLFTKQRRAQRQPQPLPVPPSPSQVDPTVKPRLHDETLLSVNASGLADNQGAWAVRHVTVVAGAPQQTYALPRGHAVVIGRHSSHGITLMNHAVSRDHARLVLVNGAVQITDLGSLNGTFIGKKKHRRRFLLGLLLHIRTNGLFAGKEKQQLPPHTPAVLAAGEVFWIGPNTQLIVDASPLAPTSTTLPR